jgi:hypothetical protein
MELLKDALGDDDLVKRRAGGKEGQDGAGDGHDCDDGREDVDERGGGDGVARGGGMASYTCRFVYRCDLHKTYCVHHLPDAAVDQVSPSLV